VRGLVIRGAKIFRPAHLRQDALFNLAQGKLIARLHLAARFILIVALLGLLTIRALSRAHGDRQAGRRQSREGRKDTEAGVFHNDVMPSPWALNKL